MSTVGDQPSHPRDTKGRPEAHRKVEACLLTTSEGRPTTGHSMVDQSAGMFDPQAVRHLGECVPRAIARVLANKDAVLGLAEARNLSAAGECSLSLAEARDLCAAGERPALRELRAAAMSGKLKTTRVRGKLYTTVEAVQAVFGPPAPSPDDTPSSGEHTQPVPTLADTAAS